jgi:hypothetical protein
MFRFLSDYQAHNVDEDIAIGTSILKVKAADADSGQNAEIEYYLSDDHFTVSPTGVISNNRRLDADSNNAYYEFVVTAKDKGKNWLLIFRFTIKLFMISKVNPLALELQLFGSTQKIRTTSLQNFPNKCTHPTLMKMPGPIPS